MERERERDGERRREGEMDRYRDREIVRERQRESERERVRERAGICFSLSVISTFPHWITCSFIKTGSIKLKPATFSSSTLWKLSTHSQESVNVCVWQRGVFQRSCRGEYGGVCSGNWARWSPNWPHLH